MTQNTPLHDKEFIKQSKNATFISIVTAMVMVASGIFVLLRNNPEQLILVVPLFIASLISIWLSRTGRHVIAGWLMITVVSLQAMISPLGQTGLGYSGALAAFGIIGCIALVILPRKMLWQTLLVSILVAAATILIDASSSPDRPAVANPEGNWIFTGLLVAFYFFLLIRQFPTFPLRTKIILGILLPGGISLAALAIFLFFRANTITTTLSNDLAESVKQSIESELRVISIKNSLEINEQFKSISDDISQLAVYRASLQDQAAILSTGTYWDAKTRLVQLPGGQYGSLPEDSASVFVPSTVPLTDSIIADLNITSFMDINAYGILKKHPSIGAVYYLTTSRLTTYYPNINLASIVPPDFDITTQNFYIVADPENDPDKLAKWTNAYQDPAGIGLIITIAAPVYINNNFAGVAAADLKLDAISQIVEGTTVGKTGFSFMIDRKGRIISMPAQGYDMFGIQPETLNPSEEIKQSVIGKGPIHLQPIMSKAAAGNTNLNEITINGINNYVVYTQIPSTGYSLVIVVPTDELSDAIVRSRQTVNTEISSTITYGGIILGILFILATLASLGIGSLISAPVKQLTQTAEQIAAGDIAAQAVYETDDEIGRLAGAFNNMTQQLRDLLSGLEQRVADRSVELASVSLKNERRAAQFQAIAKVVEAISITRNLNELLPEITKVISQQFGFYHVGIFLLNESQEFAVLSAANSAGGQLMLSRGHRLKVGVLGIVGSVAATKRPLIALDTGTNAAFFNNPDLPETRSEMALPLLTATDIIGVLDVQSREPNAFGLEDIEVLGTLAGQVSLAIINARLYEQTGRTLLEAETLSREALQTGWGRYTKSQKVFGIRHSGSQASILREKTANPAADEVLRTGLPVKMDSTSAESDAQLLVPVKLRGEIIGVLNIRASGQRKWTDDDIEVASTIVERAAIALENARLLFDSQKRADKERLIGEITTKIGSFISKDNILQSTAAEIGRIMPGTEVIVQLRRTENGHE